jgi:hypothetical protein
MDSRNQPFVAAGLGERLPMQLDSRLDVVAEVPDARLERKNLRAGLTVRSRADYTV